MSSEVSESTSIIGKLSLSELQNKPIYYKRDIIVSNPRKLYRFISNVISEEGYYIKYNSVNIQKDPVGETGVVDAYIIGAKTVKDKKSYSKRIIHPLAKIFSIIGILLILTGYLGKTYLDNILDFCDQILVFGILVFLSGIVLAVYIKHYKTLEMTILSTLVIHVKGIGETYRGVLESGRTENRHEIHESAKKEIAYEKVITEMTIHLAGDIDTKYNEQILLEINKDIIKKDLEKWNEQMKEILRTDIEHILEKLDKFAE